MDQLTPAWIALLDPLAPCFRPEVFALFRRMVVAWIVCLGRRTISRVWETTGQAPYRHHAAAYRLFSQAVWNFDEVARILLVRLLAAFVPGSRVWIVVDDTLCHKRGAKVAFGGIFLDAVLSTKRHKTFRFGTNWVLLGLVVQLRGRPERFFCLPLLWRVYEKQGNKSKAQHRTKPQLAADLVGLLAGWLPGRQLLLVADSAYISKGLLYHRPSNVEAIGPLCWKAALWQALPGQRPQAGQRLLTPAQLLADDQHWPARTRWITFPNGRRRRLHLKQFDGVCWPSVAGDQPVRVLLVRDPKGEWRNEALVSTDATLPDWLILTGYCRRWSVEVAFCDAKQQLGFHDPQVWSASAVERATPMAWLVGTLVVLWYAEGGQEGKQARRQQPWYRHKRSPTFADMLSSCRLEIGQHWLEQGSGGEAGQAGKWAWLLEYIATAT
jgi:DDE superfamily endonuclease